VENFQCGIKTQWRPLKDNWISLPAHFRFYIELSLVINVDKPFKVSRILYESLHFFHHPLEQRQVS